MTATNKAVALESAGGRRPLWLVAALGLLCAHALQPGTLSAQAPGPTQMTTMTEASDMQATNTNSNEAAASPQSEARRARVFARIGDEVITVGDIEDELATMAPFMRARHAQGEALEAFAMEMLDRRLLVREARNRGTDQHVEVLDAYREALVQRLYQHETASLTVSDEAIAEYEAANPEQTRTPEERRVSILLVGSEAEAQELLPRARVADTRAFRELVREHSIDEETNRRGGDLRYFMRDGHAYGTPRSTLADEARVDEPGHRSAERDVHAAIARAAFELETLGQVAGPIAVEDNFAIVRLTGLRAEEATAVHRAQLSSTQRGEAMEALAARLREEATVTVSDEHLHAITLEGEDEDDEDGFLRAYGHSHEH